VIFKVLFLVLLGLALFSGGRKLAALGKAVGEVPRAFKDGKKRAEDPAGAAKPVNAPSDNKTA
jgi:Sec-independent protein translocase protein TatA